MNPRLKEPTSTFFARLPEEKITSWNPPSIMASYIEEDSMYYLSFTQFKLGYKQSEPIDSETVKQVMTKFYEDYYISSYRYVVTKAQGSDSISKITFYDGDSVLFSVVDERVSPDNTTQEERTPSPEFWDSLHTMDDTSTRILEDINGKSLGQNSVRIPVINTLPEAEKELVVHISRLLISNFKSDFILGELGPLKKLIHTSYGRSSYGSERPYSEYEVTITDSTPSDQYDFISKAVPNEL